MQSIIIIKSIVTWIL